MRRAALWFLLLPISCGSGDPASGSPANPARSRRPEVPAGAPLVVFMGDSISAGLHLPRDEAFPHVLHRRLLRKGIPFRLVNAGISGDTAAGGASRVGWLLDQEPEILVVELGGNDGLRGTDLADIERNLRTILTAARDKGARVLLLGMVIPPNYGLEYATGFGALYARLARDFAVEFVPFFMRGVGGVPAMNLPDGLHPTAAGHEALADNIQPVLERMLGRK